MGIAQDFDITKNIRLIEMLKNQLLTNVADLYTNLSAEDANLIERKELLSDLIIITYMLSNRLGFSHSSIDIRAVKKLRLGILDEKQSMYTDTASLLRHLSRNV